MTLNSLVTDYLLLEHLTASKNFILIQTHPSITNTAIEEQIVNNSGFTLFPELSLSHLYHKDCERGETQNISYFSHKYYEKNTTNKNNGSYYVTRL